MPVICRFYGIGIKMYFNDHTLYGEYNGVFDIESFEMIEGDLPKRAKKLVQEWAAENKEELKCMWETKNFNMLKGLE